MDLDLTECLRYFPLWDREYYFEIIIDMALDWRWEFRPDAGSCLIVVTTFPRGTRLRPIPYSGHYGGARGAIERWMAFGA